MTNYRRVRISGGSYFFTVCLNDRTSDLLVREVELLRRAVAQTRRERPFKVAAWVVLPDHMHCIWTLPEGDHDFSTRWGAIKARFSREMCRAGFTPPPVINAPKNWVGRNGGVNPALRVAKGEVGIWQRRFWEHCIRDEADYAAHVRCCWFNPVKHGFVARAVNWPYSSIHRDMRLRRVGSEWGRETPNCKFGE